MKLKKITFQKTYLIVEWGSYLASQWLSII